MNNPLSKQVVLLTGGAKGLGRHMALTLAAAGYRVAFTYRTSECEASALTKQIEAAGGEALALQADISRSDELSPLVERVIQLYGHIDILINNAGPFTRQRRKFSEYDQSEIHYLINSNMIAAMELDLLVLPGMRERGFGRIIHFGFAHASETRAWPHRAVYAAAKVGLLSFTKTLAVEEAEYGITVNMVCPADIKGVNKHRSIAEVSGEIDEESPRIRPGSGEDVSRMVHFLLQPESDFITGSIIDVSGGMDPIRVWPLPNPSVAQRNGER
jgi:3-oxoacyl-[acyl-carrier protein] reductase